MFAARATKLYDAYLAYPSVEAFPAAVRTKLEREVLGASFDAIWAETLEFWQRRAPSELARAQRDPKHRLALMFRWYLGKSSRWAIDGESSRRLDYQIWCGSAMGAFNQWARGTYLANPEHRTAAQIALNLLEGAAAITRAQQLRAAGVHVPGSAFDFPPRPLG
jgi:PfaD family protein